MQDAAILVSYASQYFWLRYKNDVAVNYSACDVVYRDSRNVYRNDPKFSDRYAWANSADPAQTPSASFGLITR